MDDDQQFCLRWNNHQSTLISVFDTLLENETLVDCTLAAEGKFLKAHKVVLSACSPYFATLLQEQYDKHPIFILKDVKYQELRAMMDYMYRGEVNISQDQLAALLKAAESLQIKGLSDNRTGGGNSSGGGVPKHDQHRGLSVPGSSGVLGGGKLSSGYTLEQTKRARMGPSSIDSQDMSGSREGSSSPTSRRRRKVRRRSIENALADVHDNSNSSQIQPNASSALLQQSNASLGGVGAITAAASALASQVPVSAATLPSAAAAAVSASTIATTTQGTTQQLTTATNVTKKTESVKGTSGGDALHTELLVHGGAGGNLDEQQQQHGGLELKSEKLNHKQQKSVLGAGNIKDTSSAAELVIEPKSEYDDDGNDETVEDLTLDDEDMGMEDLDHNAGTSHGNEGSSQGYAQWQHDRSQDEVFMATQEAQQRDPQDSVLQQKDGGGGVVKTTQAQSAQSESRIRVRNWLMLADQSILEKSIKTAGSGEVGDANNADGVPDKLTTTNAIAATTVTNTSNNCNNNSNNNVIIAAAATTVTTALATTTATISNVAPTALATKSSTTTTSALVSPPTTKSNATGGDIIPAATTTTNTTQTMTRIGSIGRTTIACITTGNNNNNSTGKNGNTAGGGKTVGLLSTAALAAAGVELDSIDDNMTEVIVKIENTASSIEDDEDEQQPVEGEEDEDEEEEEDEPHTEDGEGDDDDDDDDYNYDLKLSSPISWAFDTVKIENEEEFEDIDFDQMDPDKTEDNIDDLLTTAAAAASATTKSCRLRSASMHQERLKHTQLVTRSGITARKTYGKKQRILNSKHQQQQHQQHPQTHQQVLHLPSIPATITSITAPVGILPTTKYSSNLQNQLLSPQQLSTIACSKNSDFQATLSEDKKYRILIQNQRMRKESLEHSEDMIYNADIEKPWVCKNCNRNYKWKNSLKCHLKNECGQPPRYFCSKLCGYATNVHSNLKRHLNTKCKDRIEEEQKATDNSSTYTLVLQKQD